MESYYNATASYKQIKEAEYSWDYYGEYDSMNKCIPDLYAEAQRQLYTEATGSRAWSAALRQSSWQQNGC